MFYLKKLKRPEPFSDNLIENFSIVDQNTLRTSGVTLSAFFLLSEQIEWGGKFTNNHLNIIPICNSIQTHIVE